MPAKSPSYTSLVGLPFTGTVATAGDAVTGSTVGNFHLGTSWSTFDALIGVGAASQKGRAVVPPSVGQPAGGAGLLVGPGAMPTHGVMVPGFLRAEVTYTGTVSDSVTVVPFEYVPLTVMVAV